ncbi:hypothetical protein BH23GEM5_BH23GEM5_22460 [soil metagenome]
MRLRFPLAAFVLAVATGCATAPAVAPPPAAPMPAAGATATAITAADLRLRFGIIAHDSMAGRAAATPGGRATANYLAREAARMGLQPAGDGGSYFHRVPLTRRTTVVNTLQVSGPRGDLGFTTADVVPVSGGGLPASSRTAGQGAIIFGGYLQDPSLPAARELRPQQLGGSVLLLRLAAPGVDAATTPPRAVLAPAFAPGSPVAAVLLVAEGELAEYFGYARDLIRRGQLSAGSQAPGPADVPRFFLISPAAAERLLAGPLTAAREPRAGLGTFRYALQERTAAAEGMNVVAVLPGSNPATRTEYVALGAHYDHLGIGTPVAGDSIYNGADDDASGTAALLEIAERFANLPPAQRPARSLLFVWHDAEEDGLLGSEAFTDRPTVPRGAIVTQLNIDMVGRNSPDSLSVVGSRRLSTELGSLVEAVNQRQSPPFQFDYTFDTPNHPERIYCRSDHYSYARYGIPVVFFTTGLHPDYHKPSDTPEKLDYDKVARVSRLVSDITAEIANRPARPRVDQPVPPLGTPCQ